MSDEQHSTPAESHLEPATAPEKASLSVGDRVRIATQPPYVKTAETMPMLRPPHVVKLGEEGTVVDYRPGNHWSVRFEQGTFLIDSQYLEKV